MAFDRTKFALANDTIGGGSLRIHFYQTPDSDATVMGANYFTSVEKMGVRENDLVIVTTSTGTVNAATFVGEFTAMSAAGHGTVIISILELLDEDDLASVSTVKAPTQASVKNYVDTRTRRKVVSPENVKYVNSVTGHPDNDGSIGAPWLTLADAVDWIYSVDCDGLTMATQCTGTFTAPLHLEGIIAGGDERTIVFNGIDSDGVKAHINIPSGDITGVLSPVYGGSGARFWINNFQITDNGNLANGTSVRSGIQADGAGTVVRQSNITVNALWHGTGTYRESAPIHALALGQIQVITAPIIKGNTDIIVKSEFNGTVIINTGVDYVFEQTGGVDPVIRCNHYARGGGQIRYIAWSSNPATWDVSAAPTALTNVRKFELLHGGSLAASGAAESDFGGTVDGIEARGVFFNAPSSFETSKFIHTTVDLSAGSGSTTVAIGYIPRLLRFEIGGNGAAANLFATAWRVKSGGFIQTMRWNNGFTADSWLQEAAGGTTNIGIIGATGNFALFSIGTFTNTGFTLTWTITGTVSATVVVTCLSLVGV